MKTPTTILSFFSLEVLPSDLYYHEGLKFLVLPFDYVWISALTLSSCLLSSFFPAYKAMRIEVIEALKFE